MITSNDTRAGLKWNAPQGANLAGRLKQLRLWASYHVGMPKQLNIAGWEREAIRLALEYHRTDREIHLIAFERHVVGMSMNIRSARTRR